MTRTSSGVVGTPGENVSAVLLKGLFRALRLSRRYLDIWRPKARG